MQVVVQGQTGKDYRLETSTDLVNWTFWTNGTAVNGVVSVTDADFARVPARYYRAVLVP
jgi:hypothetical protein